MLEGDTSSTQARRSFRDVGGLLAYRMRCRSFLGKNHTFQVKGSSNVYTDHKEMGLFAAQMYGCSMFHCLPVGSNSPGTSNAFVSDQSLQRC